MRDQFLGLLMIGAVMAVTFVSLRIWVSRKH